MNNLNYDKLMMQTIKGLKGKPRLLLHSCCAPCSTACIERLMLFFDITVYYYNPNIDGVEEFSKRATEQKHLCESLSIPYVIEDFDPKEFYKEIVGFEDSLEGGERCEKCFHLRLRKTADFAMQNGFEYFATTLTVSPLKNANIINEIGLNISKNTGTIYLPSDFKKRGGYQRSIELSKDYELYRQNYCGCIFSKRANP